MASLADKFAAAKIAYDLAKAEMEALKAQIIESGVESIIGDNFAVTVSLSERTSLDQKAVKALLTPAQIMSVSTTSVITTVRYKAIMAEVA
jgi:hypothetical protein